MYAVSLIGPLYDAALWVGERGGMRARRAALLEQARGTVVEIGAGTGLNLRHYPDQLDELVLTEPDPAMFERLEQRRQRLRPGARVVLAGAEELPFADASVDLVVATLVLCTVPDPGQALTEIRRILRLDGTLLLIEHVRSETPSLARWQDRLEPPWRWVARGCNCNRPTVDLLEAHGFDTSGLEHSTWKHAPPIVKPLVVGLARRTQLTGS